MKLLPRIVAALTLILASLSTAQAARPGKPMELFLDNPISTASGTVPAREQIETAMIRAGLQRQWQITRNADGTLNAHLSVRQHTLDVTITLHDTRYDIAYKDSTNLKYAPNPDDPDRPIIHPSYNKWLKNLISDFNAQFGVL